MNQGNDERLARLIADARAGDDRAFETLVRRCYDRIYRWALVRTGAPDDADDVAQETLMRMYRYLATYDGRARFTTWLYRLVANAAADLHRDRARRARGRRDYQRHGPVAIAGPVDPDRPAIDEARALARLEAFLGVLSDRQRQAFDLVDLQGYSPAEAAEMLELEPGTVRTHLFRARRTIRRRMLEEHPELVEGYGP